MRQIVLDTETTGLETTQGHRIIEIGCVELQDRRHTGRVFHQYLQPDRAIDVGAIEVHGITDEFLADKPRFGDVMADFLDFITGAELIIHNAPFDVGFLDHELRLTGQQDQRVTDLCQITDTLVMARRLHPGQRNSLDALCQRYEVDNTHREKHGALLDAEILADVYLMMTGGQVALSLDQDEGDSGADTADLRRLPADRPPLTVIRASTEESQSHEAYLDALEKASGICAWRHNH
jgi:DNA polymerase III subunit epsilon